MFSETSGVPDFVKKLKGEYIFFWFISFLIKILGQNFPGGPVDPLPPTFHTVYIYDNNKHLNNAN